MVPPEPISPGSPVPGLLFAYTDGDPSNVVRGSRIAFADQWCDGGIARKPTPVDLPFDFDGPKYRWHTERREEDLR